MSLTLHIAEGDVTKAIRMRYIARIKRAQRAIGRLDDRGVRAIRRDLGGARSGILTALLDATEFGQWHFPHVKNAIEEAMVGFRSGAQTTLDAVAEEASSIGIGRVQDLAVQSHVEINAPNFKFAVPKDHLEFAQGWAADLIQGESDDIVKMVSREIRLSMAGGMTREQLVGQVQKKLTKTLRFGTFRKRAEAIVRTESNRVFNASAQAARQTLAADNVTVQKQWVSSGKPPGRRRTNHQAMNGQTIGVDEKFRMVGQDGLIYRPMYPLDPILPAGESVHCGCAVIEVFEVMEESAAEIAAGVNA